MTDYYRFAVADNHPHWRQVLIELILARLPGYRLAFEAPSGKDLIGFIRAAPIHDTPDLVILDLHMPGLDGFQTAKWLHANRPQIRMMTFSLDLDELSVIRLLKFGVTGFLHKSIDGEDLLSAISRVRDGEWYFSALPGDHDRLSVLDIESLEKIKGPMEVWNTMSDQDRQLLDLCCSDLDDYQIAREMGTVGLTYIRRMMTGLFEKFKVRNRLELCLLVHRSRLRKFFRPR